MQNILLYPINRRKINIICRTFMHSFILEKDVLNAPSRIIV
ncbi:hypothetical protein DCCM_0185 [Desulfocucumis palustris]|uniref:Uncharacterized protein n=1 Tax=Desulfocucumis palustris TaxID=1898651 RepID=A0A2L2X7V8_9FIRM|nr:hypothetical protein DCCM_0185 [Desulfocucumis palustris]